MKLTPDVRIQRVIIGPEEELDKSYIVPDMKANSIPKASLFVGNDGYAYVSWLEPVPGWRKDLDDLRSVFVAFSVIGMAAIIFWTIGDFFGVV
jgi:hypothetical protein